VEYFCETQLRDHSIIDVEQQLVTVALGFGVSKKRVVLPPATCRRGLWVIAHRGESISLIKRGVALGLYRPLISDERFIS
jgi:hypothetical protein